MIRSHGVIIHGFPLARRGLLVVLLATLSLLAVAPKAAETMPRADDPPPWFKVHMQFLVAGSGRWITDNSAYRSDSEPFDEYGIHWSWGVGQQSVVGRLLGLADGEDVGTFWQFRIFWHPEGRGVIQQWGPTGAYAEGEVHDDSERGGTTSLQTLFGPDGSVSEIGHRSTETGNLHRTDSFDVVNGEWRPRRQYVWKRTD